MDLEYSELRAESVYGGDIQSIRTDPLSVRCNYLGIRAAQAPMV